MTRRRLCSVSTGTVAVVGAGSWGTTIGSLLATKVETVLWARRAEIADAINTGHENQTYLPGIMLAESLEATSSLAAAVHGARVVLMAVPSHGFRAVLADLVPSLERGVPIVSLAKGIESGTNLRMSEIVAQVAPDHPAGVLTGPNLAREVAEGQPAATVVALEDITEAQRIQELLHTGTFRVVHGD